MACSTRRIFCMVTVLLCGTSGPLYFYIFLQYETYAYLEAIRQYGYIDTVSESDLKMCGATLKREVTVPVKNAKAFLVSAYLDERFSGAVRVIGIVYRYDRPRFYCHVCRDSSVLTWTAQLLIHSDHFGFPYGTADFLCQVPDGVGPVYAVSISTQREPDPTSPFLRIRNAQQSDMANPPLRHFSVCLSTLFGNYSNVLQFVQSMEMYRILGAEKVFIYKTDCSPLLQRVLDFYSAEGFLEVIPWDIHRYLKVSSSWTPSKGAGDLHYHGQIAALNDCIYRNMYDSTYVVLLDADEVIVPKLHSSWRDMMAFLSQRHLGVESFAFDDYVFRQEVFGDGGTFDKWPDVPGVNILRHVHREPLTRFGFNARKMVVNPRAVVWTSVHSTLWQRGATFKVPSVVGRLHHCRAADNRQLGRRDLLRDTTLWKYSSPLIGNVSRVLHLALNRGRRRRQRKGRLL
ncbi:beta-1,4-galactosyltransferase galt-1-like [Megalops cyprinoides]|uniref:beta-1,4-galactosyltransferase galt-1-like n=1 Tax=Megalops cyprinoides TaxID=118141 RepID=UPI0018651224|nr:beta-1,4-galactosyltransferase galt-1-like [Megalops cyprinoides]XP_036385679.1 beta-1,4-galactosyltransferase galt-1-like [Megalops cyprinoides]